jgi:hypothetical protein
VRSIVDRRSPANLAAAAAVIGALAVAAAGGAQPSAPPTLPMLPLAVNVAEHEGSPVVTDAWIDGQVEQANTIFGAHGVRFRIVARHRIDPVHARVETRSDRHRLGGLLHRHVVDCFFVLSLRDVDEPELMRRGVHWRPRGYPPGSHFVIVSSISGPLVLAHELGHYFGNTHSDVPGNIMSYTRGEVPPYFDEEQARRIHASVRHFLGRRQLLPADSFRAPAGGGGDPASSGSAR